MFEELKDIFNRIEQRLENLFILLDLKTKEKRIKEIEALMSVSDFWKDITQSNKLIQELKLLKSQRDLWHNLNTHYRELRELSEISTDKDIEMVTQIKEDLDKINKDLDTLELKNLFSGDYDLHNAILSINAGAGGTEACDWVSMLLRMYGRFAEVKNFKFQVVDILAGEEAGIKNVTTRVEGDYAYGNLKSERGVHRLVRISPFDANKRRHTSFASVDVIPEVTEGLDIQIKDEEIRIDTYRASGPGGQHVQKSDTAVRITHIPSGLVAQCQNERSQYQNKQTAFSILKARLFELRQRELKERMQKINKEKQKIEWGSQIRSYILQPYSLVKDHRTNYETGNVQGVLDGEIEGFIVTYLKKFKE